MGTVGAAIGSAGIQPLKDLRGRSDRSGRRLRSTVVGIVDELASAASLVQGGADEGVPAVLIRGVEWAPEETGARSIVRPADRDLFR
jgi:coenzyme F420-0:L-glutamate ligase/coenzyme F420-1:gamma-L-glutamate ligase